MLTIQGSQQRLCGGVSRRDFIRVGTLGGIGLGLPGLLRAREPVPEHVPGSFGRARRCLLLFLTGGPPHLDTWDLKPDAPDRIRGELKPIATRVPGILVSELFPKVARCTDRLCLVRSVTHADNTHTSAGYTMLTGVPHPAANAITAANIRPTPNDHPHIGSLLARSRFGQGDAPPFVSLPEIIKDAGVNVFPGQDAGMLGSAYAPFPIEANQDRTALDLPAIFLPRDVSWQRLAAREGLLQQVDRAAGWSEAHAVKVRDAWFQRALDVIHAPDVRTAFDLDREPAILRESYGRHLFGQGCLLARRLLEAGVALVTVYWHYEGPDDSPVWDTHQNNFAHLRRRLMPPTDDALAALLDDLAERGMLDDTLVVCLGEFGRTPVINKHAGRDHWSAANSIVFAGAGIQAGSVYGATNREGAYPADKPVAPADVTATVLHLLGVPADLEIHDRTGRPLRACQGSPIRGILAGQPV